MLIKQIFLVVILFGLALSAYSEEVVLIAHKDMSISAVSKKDVKKLFLGKSKSLIGVDNLTPINQGATSVTRNKFDQSMMGKSSKQMKAYWAQRMFSGKGVPPEELENDQAVLDKVTKCEACIGYVLSGAVNDSVVVVPVN